MINVRCVHYGVKNKQSVVQKMLIEALTEHFRACISVLYEIPTGDDLGTISDLVGVDLVHT